MPRKKVFLVCEECLSRNYTFEKRTDDPVRMELKKFCPRCGKHTLHKESK
ncbi:MAG: 50S ribosomal protein L33 [Bacilli bacterium]|nr:50S ribosomal protein L33 [Bacilli bacterium]